MSIRSFRSLVSAAAVAAVFPVAISAFAAEATTLKDEPVVPYVWRRGEVDRMVTDLKEIHGRSGLKRFLITGPGFNEVMFKKPDAGLYGRMGCEIAAVKAELEPLGVEIGWWCSPSIRSVSDFTPIEDAKGAKSADNKKCPLDPAFQADWAAKVKAVVAAARPSFVNIEDDYTLSWGRGLDNGACFCTNHLSLFAETYGKPLSAAEINAAFERRTGENLPIRRAFAATIRESLCRLARRVRAAVDEVDPSVRICVCEPGDGWDKDGDALEAVARAFAGPNTRPAVRPSGAIYGAQTTPADIPGALGHTLYTLERQPKEIEMFYEADPYPHNRFFTSAAQMGSLMAASRFMGAQNIQFYCLQYLDDPLEDAGYVDMYRALRPRLDAVRAFNAACRPHLAGVRIVWTSDALALTRGYGHSNAASLYDMPFQLSKFGLPYTTRGDGPAVLAGQVVESLSDETLAELLSGGVLADAPAADLLAKRGFGADLGVDVALVSGRPNVIREEIQPAAGLTRKGREVNAFYIFCAGTEGTVHTFATLKPHAGAEVWSRFSGVGGDGVTPSLTLFANARGGRVAVLATSLVGNRSSGLLNLRKQELMRNLFLKLSPGCLPVSAVDAPGIWTLASVSDDAREMMVMVNNLSGDVREGQPLAFESPWTDAEIFRLDAQGRRVPLGKSSARWTIPFRLEQMSPEFLVLSR